MGGRPTIQNAKFSLISTHVYDKPFGYIRIDWIHSAH